MIPTIIYYSRLSNNHSFEFGSSHCSSTYREAQFINGELNHWSSMSVIFDGFHMFCWNSQKFVWTTLSRELLCMLERQQLRSWHEIVILDELWFYLKTDHEFIWLPLDGEIPERECHRVQSREMMFIIVWNLAGFHLIHSRSWRTQLNEIDDETKILSPLASLHETQVGKINRKLIWHSEKKILILRKGLGTFWNKMKWREFPIYPPSTIFTEVGIM
jgi:hypothetical protein